MRAAGALRAALLFLIAGTLYATSLGNDFVWDDRLTAVASPRGPLTVLTTRTGGYYRPLIMLSFALDRALWGTWPAGFHATNVVCHAAVAWLVGALAAALGAGSGAALAAAIVFLAHPVQTEAVTYISGRTDVLCALFVLLALLAWRRARRATDGFAWACSAALVGALLAKEAGVVAPLVLLVPGAHPDVRAARPVLPLAVAAAWLAAWALTGGPGVHPGGLAARLPAVAVSALTYVRLLVWPAPLHLERFVSVPGWPVGVALAAWLGVAGVLAVLVLLARRVPGGPVLLALAVLLYLPASGVVPVYPAIADRALFAAEHFLYLPLLGLAPLVVAAVWPKGASRLAPAALATLVLAWAVVILDRNRDWRNEETLFADTLRYDPPAARVWFNAANLALAQGRLDQAAGWYTEALARAPHDGAAHLNLGITRQRQDRRVEAEEEYRRAIASEPRLAEAYRALAALLAARGEQDEAARLWAEGQRRGGG